MAATYHQRCNVLYDANGDTESQYTIKICIRCCGEDNVCQIYPQYVENKSDEAIRKLQMKIVSFSDLV